MARWIGRALWVGLAVSTLHLPAFADPIDPITTHILELESTGRARPTEAARRLDALREATAPHSPQRLELLTVQGLMLALASQFEAAEKSAAQLEAWGDEPKADLATSAKAAAGLIRARSMAHTGDLQRAGAMMRQAITLLPARQTPRDQYRFKLAQAYLQNEAGQFDDAIRAYHEALDLADTDWRQSETRTSLAYSFFEAGQLDRARALTTEAVLLAERAHDRVALGKARNTEAIVLAALGDHEGERRSLELAIDCARREGDKTDEVNYLANLADAYLKSGQYETALERAERALGLARDLHDPGSETIALANIGLAQISLHRIDLGKRYVREAMAADQRRGSVSGVSEILHDLGMTLEKAGDLPGAVEAYHEHRRLATTLLRDDQQRAILATQAQYDADRRGRELELLKREHDITAERLRQRDLQQRLWALVAAASILALAVITLLYRRVRRGNVLLKSSNERLKVQSEHDPLTGLANRQHLRACLARQGDEGRLAGTVFLIDIDHFKDVNDRHGHRVGDTVLVEVARRLREALREEDWIVRWGGEEFLVVVPASAPEQVEPLAERLLAALGAAPVMAGLQRIEVSASIGFATFPIGPAALRVGCERALRLVDAAMYLAKAHGRNRAYGVQWLEASEDETRLDAIAASLEAARREGRVALTLLRGRPAWAAAA